MSREQIINTFKQLACGQGFYGRLLQGLEQAEPEDREAFLSNLEAQNFKDSVDLVMYIEG